MVVGVAEEFGLGDSVEEQRVKFALKTTLLSVIAQGEKGRKNNNMYAKMLLSYSMFSHVDSAN